MSKGLETLERLAYENACCRCQYWGKKGCSLCYQNNECPCAWLEIWIELKTFEIIKKKHVNLTVFRITAFMKKEGADWYNSHFSSKELHLTNEEFDLVKEVLK